MNYANGSFSGFSFFESQPANTHDCFVYVTATPSHYPSNCALAEGQRPRNAIAAVQSPPSPLLHCFVLETDATASGQWQPIVSSNAGQIVRYQSGTLHTTSSYNESDDQSSSSWSIGVTVYFVSLGINGGSGSSMLNGHLSQSEAMSTETFESTILG